MRGLGGWDEDIGTDRIEGDAVAVLGVGGGKGVLVVGGRGGEPSLDGVVDVPPNFKKLAAVEVGKGSEVQLNCVTSLHCNRWCLAVVNLRIQVQRIDNHCWIGKGARTKGKNTGRSHCYAGRFVYFCPVYISSSNCKTGAQGSGLCRRGYNSHNDKHEGSSPVYC